MRLAPPPRRPVKETVIPMINVVFLLLVFFLLAARIAPPDPADVAPPEAQAAAGAIGPDILYVARDGTPWWQGRSGEAALAALAGRNPEQPLTVRADRGADGAAVAALLARVGAGPGGAPLRLVVQE